MLKFEHREIINRYINCELAIRTVERDLNHLDDLKLKYAIHASLNSALETLRHDMKHIKSELKNHNIKYVKDEIVNEYFIEYMFLRDKVESEITYSRHALLNTVNEIINDMFVTKSHAYTYKFVDTRETRNKNK